MELEYLKGYKFMVEVVIGNSVTVSIIGSGDREKGFWKE
jgi:hypothetical protein